MAHNLIVQAGTALYGDGDGWQSELARQLGVPSRTVRHWIAGDYSPRPGVYRDILALIEGMDGRMATAAAALRAALEGGPQDTPS